MVVNRISGSIEHHRFRDLPDFLERGDTIVLNTTRVFKARLTGTRDSSGAPAEIFLLSDHDNGIWEAMVQPGAKLKPGRRVTIAADFAVEIVSATARGTRMVRLHTTLASEKDAIDRYGHIPLPPYIERDDDAEDTERYQTVFSNVEGSVAAPTAGLHFTPRLLDRLSTAGVRRAEVLLHVGAGTFKPVEVDDPADHEMHEEWFSLPEQAAELLNVTRSEKRRICSVGTTALRTLESSLTDDGRFSAASGETRIFIRPPARPRSADMLVTNFHLPRSTLLMLVAAMAGYDLTMEAYRVAVREGYRFYSYGDAMLIL